MALELHALHASLSLLQRSLRVAKNPSANVDQDTMETLRAGVVQHFEVAYEQCWKMIKRWLETNVAPDAGDGISRRELFRRAVEHRLIDSVDVWMDFHAARNLTSHTYDLQSAERAYVLAVQFLPEGLELSRRLEARND